MHKHTLDEFQTQKYDKLGNVQESEGSSSPGKLMVIPKGNYRKIAQKNWGLTNKQMEGMQVHHRILSSEGGSNDPANLYVCSPEYHANVWHNGDQFSIWALKGAKAGTEAQKQGRSRGGRAAAPIQTKEAAKKTGLANKGRKLKTTHNNQAAVTNSQKWRCLVTGKTSTSGPLTRYQNKRGIDTSLRERIS